VMGTGFCQTLMASAKPVAIYGSRDEAGFTQADLFRLALPLGLAKIALLVIFATVVWPAQLGNIKVGADGSAANTVTAVSGTPVALDNLGAQHMVPVAGRTVDASSAAPAMESSLWPKPRPDGLGAPPPAKTGGEPTRRTTRVVGLGARIERDLNAAGRQIKRDLMSLF
jgi:solute carrier family 13 (sodium-dependent dicarboxylate transporter), member 2/3/5